MQDVAFITLLDEQGRVWLRHLTRHLFLIIEELNRFVCCFLTNIGLLAGHNPEKNVSFAVFRDTLPLIYLGEPFDHFVRLLLSSVLDSFGGTERVLRLE